MSDSYTFYFVEPFDSPRVLWQLALFSGSPGAQGGPVCNHMSPNFDS